jgi:hypothetical protein
VLGQGSVLAQRARSECARWMRAIEPNATTLVRKKDV